MINNILVIDDDDEVRSLVSDVLSDEGYKTAGAANEAEAMSCLKSSDFDLIFLDLWIGEDEFAGLKILDKIKQRDPLVPVVMISGHGTVDSAVTAIRKGAFDFIEKPFVIDRLLLTARNALEYYKLHKENQRLKVKKIDTNVISVGSSTFAQSIESQLNKIAPNNCRVFLTAARGTCAENIAYYIHKKSNRADGPFVYLNCFRDADDSVGEKLFGVKSNSRYLDKANMGTLFLDNIEDLSAHYQKLLLQFIQESRIIVQDRYHHLDVRIICSTGYDNILESGFNQELFERLNVMRLKIPELKERREDIIPLVNYYNSNAESFFGLKPKEFTEESLAILQSYDWPGNIYQVKSIVENCLVNTMEKKIVKKNDLPAELTSSAREKFVGLNIAKLIGMPIKKAKEVFETDYLKAQVTRFSGNVSKTAEFIGMERAALHRRLKALEISVKRQKL